MLTESPTSNLIKLRELYFQRAVQQSKDSFIHFIAMFAPTLIPDWIMGRHIHVISEKLQKVESGEIVEILNEKKIEFTIPKK